MEATHNINYEGIDFEIKGYYEEADETTGYKGGWAWTEIYIDGNSVSWMLTDDIIDTLNNWVIKENY
jgi:hypothetical protein